MTATVGSIASRFRALQAKGLDFRSYAHELSVLADLSERELEAREAGAERVLAMRRRLRILEAKIREMEVMK